MRCSFLPLRVFTPHGIRQPLACPVFGVLLVLLACQASPLLGGTTGVATTVTGHAQLRMQLMNPMLSGPFIPVPSGGSIPDTGSGHRHWGHTFALGFGIVALVAVLSFTEWRWMLSRQRQLRVLVRERTQELEAEKAELLKTKAELVRFASLDALTGIFNRAIILELLEQEMARARRKSASFALILADLDYFKRINDVHGHLVGDGVLREFARRIQASIRSGDQVGRFGGEELLILLRGFPDDADERIEELHRKISERPFTVDGRALRVTASFGAVWYPAPVNKLEELLDMADQALYRAKAKGRNRVEVADWRSVASSLNAAAKGLGTEA